MRIIADKLSVKISVFFRGFIAIFMVYNSSPNSGKLEKLFYKTANIV